MTQNPYPAIILTAVLTFPLAFIVVMWVIWWRPRRMLLKGIETTGQITSIESKEYFDEEETRYVITKIRYQFQTSPDIFFTGRKTVRHKTTLQVGSVVEIRYLSANPSVSELMMFSDQPAHLARNTLISIGIACMGAATFWYIVTTVVANSYGIALCEALPILCISD